MILIRVGAWRGAVRAEAAAGGGRAGGRVGKDRRVPGVLPQGGGPGVVWPLEGSFLDGGLDWLNLLEGCRSIVRGMWYVVCKSPVPAAGGATVLRAHSCIIAHSAHIYTHTHTHNFGALAILFHFSFVFHLSSFFSVAFCLHLGMRFKVPFYLHRVHPRLSLQAVRDLIEKENELNLLE